MAIKPTVGGIPISDIKQNDNASAGKVALFWLWPGSVALLYFPFTYIISDVLTEVYGYAQARRVLWLTMASSIVAGLIYQVAIKMPPAPGLRGIESFPVLRRGR
ncbi:MAG: VUT family protein [Chloroflexi bacterium]|nr:VUT family protein [Chloroflexota bacterium]